MVFRFHSAASGGDEILVDSHTAASGGQVAASGGLFNVQLGSGTITDGSGPGTYTSLDQVFRDYSGVWLEIRGGTETLTPRVRIVSAGYALNAANATNFNGQPAGNYLDTSDAAQTKAGPITVDAPGISTTGITGQGTQTGGFFKDRDSSGYAYCGYGDRGIVAYGNECGGQFRDRTVGLCAPCLR